MVIDNFTNRLNQAMKIRNMRQVDLVNKTKDVMRQHIENYRGNGIDKTLLSKYINGAANAGNDNLFVLAEALDVNEAWLLGYDVPMERQEDISNYKEEEIKLLTEILTRKGFLDKDEKITEEDFNKLIEFAKANKQFIMNDKK